jgi:hypothetical protein
MGELRRLNGTDPRLLLGQHLIGRGPECALRLLRSYVSTQHALIRWQGRWWEILDRGSRNGTRLDGRAIEPGRPYRLHKGSTITFGHADETWQLHDPSKPEIVLVALDDGQSYSGELGLIGLPSSERPESTLFRDSAGAWRIEFADGSVRSLEDGEVLESGGRRYRFCMPHLIEATANLFDSTPDSPSVLHFSVSADEEFVELEFELGSKRVSLGSRGHNYLLLTLARGYLADAERGLPPGSRGWIDKDELAQNLGITPEQVDGEVFRVRRHFARHGLKEAGAVIERRPRTKQVRLGLSSIRIDKL